jgi:SAM-dependent methyltransferase
VQLDAEALPFRDASFDLIVMFEAIYYLGDAARFLRDCRRALAPGGVLLLSSANCEAPGFTSSAFVTRVYPARELAAMMETHGFQTRLMAGFEVRASGFRARLASVVRRLALALHLVPATLVGRERLKRLFYGPLTTLDPEITAPSPAPSPVPIDARGPVRGYKDIYAFGQVS